MYLTAPSIAPPVYVPRGGVSGFRGFGAPARALPTNRKVAVRVPVVVYARSITPRQGKGFGARGFRGFRGFGDAASIVAGETAAQTNPFLTPAYYAAAGSQLNNECEVDPGAPDCTVWQAVQAPTIAQETANSTVLTLQNYCEQNVFNNSQFGDPLDTASCNGSTPIASYVTAAQAAAAQAPAWQQAAGSASPAPATPTGTPTAVQLVNVSRPGQPFQVGDNFQLTVTGSPSQAVTGSATQNGTALGTTSYGLTDSTGTRVITGTMDASTVGNWSETWTVGSGAQTSVSFSVAAAPSSGGAGNSSTSTAGAAAGSTPSAAASPAGAPAVAGLDLSFLTNTVSIAGYNVPVWALGAGALGVVFLVSSMGGRR